MIPVRPNGDRPAWHCVGANGALTLDDVDLASVPGLTHVHLGGPEFLGGPAAGELLAQARSLGATTSVDILAPAPLERAVAAAYGPVVQSALRRLARAAEDA